MPDLRLTGMRVGRARVDLQFWRTKEGDTRYRVLRREGRLRVLRQPEWLTAGSAATDHQPR